MGKTISIGVGGDGFQNGVEVKLTRDTSVITAVVSQITPTRINAAITIPSNVPTGLWDLTVTNNDGQSETIPGAFTVS